MKDMDIVVIAAIVVSVVFAFALAFFASRGGMK